MPNGETDWAFWTAVISAGAAVVQAVGAVAAIIYSVRIASSAERRAAEAEAASTARAEAAERRAEERFEQQQKRLVDTEVNRTVDVVGSLTNELLIELENYLSHLRHQPDPTKIRSDFPPSAESILGELQMVIQASHLRSPDPDLTRALSVLADNIKPTDFGPQTIASKIASTTHWRDSIKEAYDLLKKARR